MVAFVYMEWWQWKSPWPCLVPVNKEAQYFTSFTLENWFCWTELYCNLIFLFSGRNTQRWTEVTSFKWVVSGVRLVRKEWFFFLHVHCGWDDNNALKLQQRRFRTDIETNFLMAGRVNTGLGCLGTLWSFYDGKLLRLETNLSQECFSPFLAQGH